MRRVLNFWRNIVHRRQVDADLDEELAATFDQLVAERIAAGEQPDAARRAARRELGSAAAVKDRIHDIRAGALLDAFLWDVRYGVRLLGRNRVFALTAILSLATGIGAVTSIFTVVNGLLYRAAPGVANPNTLIDVSKIERGQPMSNPAVAYRTFLDLRERMTTVEGFYIQQVQPVAVAYGAAGDSQRVFATVVSPTYFEVLGIRPAAGRLFVSSDFDETSATRLVVLSHAFWMRQLHGDRAIVGNTIVLNGERFGVIGVAAEGFWGTSVVSADLWLLVGAVQFDGTMAADPRFFTVRSVEWGILGGRLKAGVTRAQAAAEVDTISAALERDYPSEYEGRRYLLARATPIPPSIRLLLGGFLTLLLTLVALVLLTACANVAGVLLARAAARRREISVRLAIGAGRSRLIRQLLTETLLLFLVGGVVGVVLARMMTTLLLKLLPVFPVPVALSFPLDWRVLTFATIVSLAAAALAGLAPALHVSKADVVGGLKDDAQGPRDRLRLRSAFVVAQVAFSLLLIVAAGVLGRALTRLAGTAQGLDPAVTVARIDLEALGYTEVTGPAFVRELSERLRSIPGIEAATLADHVPLETMTIGPMEVPGGAPPDGSRFFAANWNIVDIGYFKTLRMRLASGREFTTNDYAGTAPVAIVSESGARLLWPGQDAVGKYIVWPSASAARPAMAFEVVGVAPDANQRGPALRERPASAAGRLLPVSMPPVVVYVPVQQRYTAQLAILLRMAEGATAERALAALTGSVNTTAPQPMNEPLERKGQSPVQLQLRIAGTVAASLGIIGVLLAAMGIYGVTAYSVARRTREIGIRIAMGAERSAIAAIVVRQAMALVGVGAAIGVVLSIAGGRLLNRVLFGVPSIDPVVYAAATLLFLMIGLAASYVPTRRAASIDPIEALRVE